VKKYAIYIILLCIVFAGIIITQSSRPSEVNWTPTFSKGDKIPYGTKIFYDLVSKKYADTRINNFDRSFFYYWHNSNDSTAIYFIISPVFTPGRTELDAMLQYAANGNTLFIASENFEDFLLDSLKVKTVSEINPANPEEMQYYNFVNKSLKAQTPYSFKKYLTSVSFSKLDSANITILGRTIEGKPDFIKIKFGYGYIYLSTIPYAFTNAAMLKGDNAEYADKCLSYLRHPAESNVYWNEYLATGREKSSLLSFIESQPALKSAYYLILCGLILFVLFEGKRRQKIIPVINPIKNTTIEFAETMGRLYFQSANHKNLAEKKILHFFDFLRTRLYISDVRADDALYFRLHSKTGIPVENIMMIFDLISKVRNSSRISEGELQALTTQIDNFYKHF
jgi:hypothetical protein